MTLELNSNDWHGLIEIKHPVQSADTFFLVVQGEAWISLTFDILVAVVASPQGRTQMTPPRHRPEEKQGKLSVSSPRMNYVLTPGRV